MELDEEINGAIIINDDSEDDDEEETNSEQKLLQHRNNNNELVTVEIQAEDKSLHIGVGVNDFDEIFMKIKQMGW